MTSVIGLSILALAWEATSAEPMSAPWVPVSLGLRSGSWRTCDATTSTPPSPVLSNSSGVEVSVSTANRIARKYRDGRGEVA